MGSVCFQLFEQCCIHTNMQNASSKVCTVLGSMKTALSFEKLLQNSCWYALIAAHKRTETSSFHLEVLRNYRRGQPCDIMFYLYRRTLFLQFWGYHIKKIYYAAKHINQETYYSSISRFFQTTYQIYACSTASLKAKFNAQFAMWVIQTSNHETRTTHPNVEYCASSCAPHSKPVFLLRQSGNHLWSSFLQSMIRVTVLLRVTQRLASSTVS